MFESIAATYDRLNRLLSLGFDERWRRRAAREAAVRSETGDLLDLASGTGDLAVALARQAPGARVLRLDLSGALLRRASAKLVARSDPFFVAEMERLPLRGGSCAAATMGFALRHVESLERLMQSCHRVLRPGGRIVFLDMSLPESGVWGAIFRFYFRRCLPRVAVLFGGEREAYEMMVRSVEGFPGWDRAVEAARRAGFSDLRVVRLTGGAARILSGRKPPALQEHGGPPAPVLAAGPGIA